jgi:4-alpha-glucanotransferase
MTRDAVPEVEALRSLAKAMGVHTGYFDGLGNQVTVGDETLLRICTTLGAPLNGLADAPEALRAARAARAKPDIPLVVIAWDGIVPSIPLGGRGEVRAELRLADGTTSILGRVGGHLAAYQSLPFGYHRLSVESREGLVASTVISAPVVSWRRRGTQRSWGLGAQLAALRSARSRSVGDLRDLEDTCRWVSEAGGDLVTLLPLLPTFNTEPAEPSPYSNVSRLFWSELMLDLGLHHEPMPPPGRLDVTRAGEEVWTALASEPVPPDVTLDDELRRYAAFRGAQAKLGRNWRDWPEPARSGQPSPDQVDPDIERFHLVAQLRVRRQVRELRDRMPEGMRLGLDLAVGVHPDGYDPWSRQALFVDRMSVGAPPDPGFPSGQDWGFAPLNPSASRREGHQYLAASIAHQAALAGVLRIDHIMAWTRLYWIPHGLGLHEGTYVSYPIEELFAVLTLESHRHQCQMVGENLGTVPPDIEEALKRHHIDGMYLAMFEAARGAQAGPPKADALAHIGTHDTPTFAGWIAGHDIEERVQYGLLTAAEAPAVRTERAAAVASLAAVVGSSTDKPDAFLGDTLEWLGRSASFLVVPWIEDLWLEEVGVNLPGTPSSVRPNWQRPMRVLLDQVFGNEQVNSLLRRLDQARRNG